MQDQMTASSSTALPGSSRRSIRRPGRIIASAVAVIVAMLSLVAAPASAASSAAPATPQCTTAVWTSEGYLPSTSSGNTYCWMLRGNYSEGVYALQWALYYCYGLNVGPNGPDYDFGGKTYESLKTLQGWYGITQDGGYGPQTRGVMAFYGGC